MKVIAYGNSDENGVMTIRNRKILDSEVKANFRNKELKITIEEKTKKRSIDQNDFYNGVVLPIVAKGLSDHGWQINGRRLFTTDVHEMFKNSFLPQEIINAETGEVIPSKASTTDLSTTAFMDFIADIQQWCAEKDIYVPDPIFEMKRRFRGTAKKKTA